MPLLVLYSCSRFEALLSLLPPFMWSLFGAKKISDLNLATKNIVLDVI
jgi:hypothetical protein